MNQNWCARHAAPPSFSADGSDMLFDDDATYPGVYWLYGFIDEKQHGFFPADHVGPGDECDQFLDSKLG